MFRLKAAASEARGLFWPMASLTEVDGPQSDMNRKP
jgi:hypothetical protein